MMFGGGHIYPSCPKLPQTTHMPNSYPPNFQTSAYSSPRAKYEISCVGAIRKVAIINHPWCVCHKIGEFQNKGSSLILFTPPLVTQKSYY